MFLHPKRSGTDGGVITSKGGVVTISCRDAGNVIISRFIQMGLTVETHM